MHRHRIKLLSRLLLGAAAMATVLAAGAPGPPDGSTVPSAATFDALLKRLEFGDLSEVDPSRQHQLLAQLEQLMPQGDAHRRLLLANQHCALDFMNANKAGYAFADARLAEALQSHDDPAAIRFYYCRGGFQQNLTTTRDALADYDRGIELARATNDEPLLAEGLEVRGGTYSVLGVHGKALADLLEAQRLFNKNEMEEAASQTLQSIGIAYRRLGYPDKAHEYLDQSSERERRIGDHVALFISTIHLGFIEQESGHADKALATHQQALELATALGDQSSAGAANLAIASDLNDLHRSKEALSTLQTAEAQFAASGDAADQGMVFFERGRALAGLNQQTKALDAFARAEAEFDSSGNVRYQEMLRQAKVQSLEADGQANTALIEFKRYLTAHDKVQQQRADEQAQMLRAQFDSDRANLENTRLRTERALQERQVKSLLRARRWQQMAMGLLAVLLGMLALLAFRQLRKLQRWKRMASVDALTGVANRRGVEHFTAAAMRHARSHHESLAVLALDIDRFKMINDSYGHAAGDRVLQHIASSCQQALRDGDFFGRIGGEEFLAVLPGSTLQRAADIAERLRSRVESLALEDLPAGLRTTISIGVAEMQPQDAGFTDLEQRADAALYRAKAAGRNRVVGSLAVSANQDLGEPPGTAATSGAGGGAAS